MIRTTRLRHELVELPKKGEEFPVRAEEATLGSLLVEKVVLDTRGGEEIVHILGFG